MIIILDTTLLCVRLNPKIDIAVSDLQPWHYHFLSLVSSALANTKDSPVLADFFEDTEAYRKEADKALDEYKKENSDFASFRVDKVERVARVVRLH